MSVSAKSITTRTHQILLYTRALHPGFFKLRDRRSKDHATYQVEAWLLDGAHMVRFNHGASCLSELVTDQDDNLPTDGAVVTLPCAGERDFEHEFQQGDLKFVTTVQTEILRENLFSATFEEMVEFAAETDAMMHRWSNSAGASCLSVLDLQCYAKELHLQSYHLIAASGMVLRTQTIFEHG